MVTLTVCYYIYGLKHIQHGKVMAAHIKQEIKQYPHVTLYIFRVFFPIIFGPF